MKFNKVAAPFAAAVLSLSVGLTGVYAAKTTTQLNQEKQNIKNRISTTQDKLNDTKAKQTDAVAELARLDEQLNSVQSELDVITNDLEETTNRLTTSQEELKQAITDRDDQYDSLKKRVRVMYENGSAGYLDVLLEADGFSDFLKRVEYVNKLVDYDNKLLNNYQHNETVIAANVKTITADKRNLEKLEKEQQAKKKTLDENIAAKNEIVKQLNSDVNTYQQQIKDLENQDAAVQKLINQANAEAAAAKKKAAAAKSTRTSTKSSSSSSLYSSSAGKVYAASKGQFMYPVPAYSGYRPNSGYGYRSSPISGGSEFHTGVDLKATLNTDVVASASGTVIYAGNRGGYGKCVIIDHGGGYSTLYAHNNAILVSVGQSVQKGQVISKAGTTGYSTGVHLHFEVRINGKHTNPTPYIYG